MDVLLIQHLSNAACELDAARDYIGVEEDVRPLWFQLLELEGKIEDLIKAVANNEAVKS
jgi:hypothetical protein